MRVSVWVEDILMEAVLVMLGTACSGVQWLPHPKGWSKLMSQLPGRQVAARACPDQNLEQICSCGRKSSHKIDRFTNVED